MPCRRTYDHRIREAIVASGDPNLFPKLNIPPSTARAWLKEGGREAVVAFEVLSEAASNLRGESPADVVMDAGVENLNRTVDGLFDSGQLPRVLAQVDVTFSNSLIEAWWRDLKHQWLYLHQLDSIATVRRLMTFYVQEHNQVMPHSAFNGLTPDEVYLGGAREPSRRSMRLVV